MTTELVIAAVVVIYAFTTALTALTAFSQWMIHRDLAREYEDRPRYADLRAEHQRKTREAARRFMQSPMWPLTALVAARRIYRDSREDK